MDSGFDAICKLIQDTPEGFAVFVINSPQNPTEIMASTIKLEDFFTLTQDSSRFFIISTTIRCGWAYFMRHLELKHFPPMTKKNDLLVNFDFKWKGTIFLRGCSETISRRNFQFFVGNQHEANLWRRSNNC